jgi:hypothetical protein
MPIFTMVGRCCIEESSVKRLSTRSDVSATIAGTERQFGHQQRYAQSNSVVAAFGRIVQYQYAVVFKDHGPFFYMNMGGSTVSHNHNDVLIRLSVVQLYNNIRAISVDPIARFRASKTSPIPE